METFKRVVSLLLCFVMLVGVVPFGAMATETTEPETTEVAPVVEEVTDSTDPTGETEEVTDEEHQPAVQADDENQVPQNANGSGTVTTKKTVYVLTNSIYTNNTDNQYLIVNSKTAGDYQALANDNNKVGSTAVKVQTDSNIGTYIELDDATDELWTTSVNNNKIALKNGEYYLGYTSSGNRPVTYTFGLSTTAREWTYSAGTDRGTEYSRLSITLNKDTYYLQYNNGWKWATATNNVYFYVRTEIEEETTVSGTYSIAGTELTKVVVNGTTATLSSALTFKPDSGAATTTDVSANAIYEWVGGADIFSGINGNTVTFNGTYGEAVVKVSYTLANGRVVTNYITVTAAQPGYKLDLTVDNKVVTGTTITKKGVTDTTTLDLNTLIHYIDEKGQNAVNMPNGATLKWEIPTEYESIATVDQNGVVSFKGKDGAFYVMATLTVDGKSYSATVNISATTSQHSVPADGVTDFPEYPNEGAIRYDKTAQAVGTFSQTGIAKMELSMTGVPYTTGSEIDVVIMLDRSSSMAKTSELKRIEATVAATKQFIKNIVINKDGTYNGNRILVADFLGGNLKQGQSHQYQSNLYTNDEQNGYQVVDSEAELNQLFDRIDSGFKGQSTLYGTEYAKGLQDCYNALQKSKADGNQQFCVFMSDGIPNYFQGEKTHFETTSDIVKMFSTSNTSSANATVSRSNTAYEYERYSTMMKNNGVTVYTVGLGLLGTNSSWSGASAQACEKVANILLNDISGPAGETAADRDTGSDINKLNKYFFSVADTNAVEDMKDVFANIAMQIMQAATDVTVEDQITDEYTMIFDIPTGHHEITGVDGQEFYIEFLKYALDEDHERTNNVTSMAKLYLHKSGNTYVAASDKNGTAYASPVFQQKPIGDKGTLYYWTTDASKGDTGVSVKVGNTTYYFVSYGLESGYNMTSGAFASGTVNATTNMSTDLIIATPYFVYNANTKMLYWTVDKLDTYEYVLNYFLYLDNSATEVGVEGKETPAGTYPTNDHAYITYTNFKGNDCRQEFPIPQMTWNGAQVSYVFYLVNAQGQPINKAGQVVDFANATFVTSVYTTAVVWNKGADGNSQGDGDLSINWLADELLPDDYQIYDQNAHYQLMVYENEKGENLKGNFFVIAGSDASVIANNLGISTDDASVNTTKVYNTKAGVKYSDYGIYSNDPVGTELMGKDEDGNPETITTTVQATNIDYANTTVAFAVVWQPKLVPDTVVVDFGLDVLIDVVQNDMLQNTISGIGDDKNVYGSTKMNTGLALSSKLGVTPLDINGNKISIENENQIRFHQGDMEFDEPVVFYYESAADFYENSAPNVGYMYSSVTVIPATTIYYEDSFVDLTVWDSKTYNLLEETWLNVTDDQNSGSSESSATQAQDRPGESQISMNLDADNIYGYDGAYENCSKYSMGSAKMVTVNSSKFAEAKFTFWGTGFDIISLTSAMTGTIAVDVYDADEFAEQEYNARPVMTKMVDTYYGYTYDNGNWVVNDNAADSLYQVPVMKIDELDYDKYTVIITVAYFKGFDHQGNGSLDFYLDAIRIYDPSQDSDAVAAYKKDKEAYPIYKELRNLIIDKNSFGSDVIVESNNASATTPVSGVVFIDGKNQDVNIADYISYGPNNELYLEPGQAIAFQLSDVFVDSNNNTIDPVDVQLAFKSVGGSANLEIFNPGIRVTEKVTVNGNTTTTETKTEATKDNLLAVSVNTATDLYYSIKDLANGTIVISNASTASNAAIISITNLKFTFEKAATVREEETVVNISEEGVVYSLRSLRGYSITETEETVIEPEVFEPEQFKVDCVDSVKAGKKLPVNVITKSDVAYITVNGVKITTKKHDKKGDKYTWKTDIATAKSDKGSQMTIEVIAYNAEGVASEAKIITVKVK